MSAAFGVASFVSSLVIGLGSAVVTARVYGVQVIGQYALAYAPTGAVWFLSTVREQPALVRALVPLEPRAPQITGLWAAVFGFSFALTLVVSLIALGVVALLFGGPIGHPELVAPAAASLGGYLLLTNTCWNLDTVLAAFRAARTLFWLRLHQGLLYLGLVIAAAAVFDSVWGMLLATIASWASVLIHRLVVVRHYMRWRVPAAELRAGRRALPKILRFGLRVTPGSLAEGVGNETGTWTLGLLGSLNEVGAYNRGWTLVRRFSELNWRLNEMLLPTLVEQHERDDTAAFDRTLVDTLRYITVGVLVTGVTAAGAAHSIMAVFGPGFDRGSWALAALLPVPALATLSTSSNSAWMVTHRPWRSTRLLGLRLAVILVAAPLLTLRFGLTGTAVGVLMGYTAEVVLQMVNVRRTVATPLHVLWRGREVAGVAVAAVGGFATARLVELALTPGVAALVPALAAGCLVAAGLYVVVAGAPPRRSGVPNPRAETVGPPTADRP